MAKPWTDADDAALRALVLVAGYAEIARKLGRTRRACETRANVLGVRRGLHRPWSDPEIAELRRMFPIMSSAEVADAMGRSETAVKEKARDFGLHKSDAYMQSIYARRRTPPHVRAETARAAPRRRMPSLLLQGRAGRFERDVGAYTPTEDAVRHLRRIAPVWRCDADGTTNPNGDHYKFSGRAMTAAEIEARAGRAGWVRP